MKTLNGLNSFEITKATPNYQPELTVLKKWNDLTPTYLSPSDFGITVGGGFSALNNSNGSDLIESYGFENNQIKVVLKDNLTNSDADKIAELSCNFIPTSGNYNNVSLKLTIKLVDKDIIPADAFTFNGVNDYVYNGSGLSNVSVSVDNTNLTGYDDTNAVSSITYSGKNFNGGTYSTSATAPTDPGVYTVRCEYTTDSHTGVAEKIYTISKKTVGYTGLTVKEKTYNGMTEAEVEGTAAIDGLVGSDTVAVDMSGITYSFENADIGTKIAVIPSAQPAISGADAWKYIIEPLELTGTITKPTHTIIIGIDSSSYRLDSEDNVDAGYAKRLDGTGHKTVDELKSAMIAKAESTVTSIGSNVQFFDFVLKKIQSGSETEDSSATAKAFIPYPDGTNKTYTFVLIHMRSDGNLEIITHRNGDYGIEFESTFSPFMLAWRSNSTGGSSGSGSSGGGGGSNFDDEQSNFWSSVRERIEKSGTGDTVKVYAEYYDKLSWRVTQALRNNPGVTLVIDWYGGSTITIPAGTALANDAGRVYYPLSYLTKKYENMKPTLTPATNPATGGKTTSVAAPAVELADFIAPAITPRR